MRVTPRAVKDLARNAGIPADVVERYLEEFITYTFTIAKRENKWCTNRLRAWIHSGEVVKQPLLSVLKYSETEEEHELL